MAQPEATDCYLCACIFLFVSEYLRTLGEKLAVLFNGVEADGGGNRLDRHITVLFAHASDNHYYIVIRNGLGNGFVHRRAVCVNAFSSYICDSEGPKLPLKKRGKIFLFYIT